MAITLGSNIASLRGQRQLSRTSAELGTVFQRLSSGQRINKASDDAAGLSIADSLNANSRIQLQGVRNLNDGFSLLNVADSALENLSAILIRLEELAEQSANGVYTNKQRRALNGEAQALRDEFFRVAKSTEFNDRRLFTGETSAVALQAGVGSSAILETSVGGAIGISGFASAGTSQNGLNSVNDSELIDVNGDGHLDLITSGGNAFFPARGFGVQFGTGNGSFQSTVTYTLPAAPRQLETGDFDGDGDIDIVGVTGSLGELTVMINDGAGNFSVGASVQSRITGGGVSVADVNGDGNMDIIAAGEDGFLNAYISVSLGFGNGTFAAARTYAQAGDLIADLALGDLNGDGIADLVVANYDSGTVSNFYAAALGNGDGTFSATATIAGVTAGLVPTVLLADLNGDENLDLVAGGSYTFGDGKGGFGSATPLSIIGLQSLLFGDTNGDGALDMVAKVAGEVAIFENDGRGVFSTDGIRSAAAINGRISLGDLNEDGVSDIVISGASGGLGTSELLLARTVAGVAPLAEFSLETMAGARQALSIFKYRRELLAKQRGQIGAYQSRIEVARSLLEVSSENFKAAEARIRDADIADESSRLVRLNILQQAASAVLAQANQQPALAIRLLS